MIISSLFIFLALVDYSHAVWIPNREGRSRIIRREALSSAGEAPIFVTGVRENPGPSYRSGSFPVRREIRDLKKNDPLKWNLFLLGMRSFQAVDQSNPLSYYQIAGIHGRPFGSWNGVAGTSGVQAGYCTHGSIIFLPWHRPYLALFEQVLYDHIQRVADAFPEPFRTAYKQAALDFRLPFWDSSRLPAVQEVALPYALWAETVAVHDTDNSNKTISNPLHHYSFTSVNQKPNDFTDAPWSIWKQTLRQPQTGAESSVSNTGLLLKAFDAHTTQFHDTLGIVMTSIADFASFATTSGGTGTRPSLENVHNDVHNSIGGQYWNEKEYNWVVGHMTDLGYSAFEPMFWLHHTNVDRLLAMWQALHPNEWVVPRAAPQDTFTIKKGEIMDEDTLLHPFRFRPPAPKPNSTYSAFAASSGPSEFWTSSLSRDTTRLNYAYPETQSWLFNDTIAYQKDVNRTIARLYGPKLGEGLSTTYASSERIGIPALMSRRDNYTDCGVAVRIRRPAALQSAPLQILFQLEKKDAGVFNMPGNVQAANKRSGSETQEWMTITGVVPLSAALLQVVKANRLRTLERDDVVKFIKQELTWGTVGPQYVTIHQGMSITYEGQDDRGSDYDQAVGPMQRARLQIVCAQVKTPTVPDQPIEYQSEWRVEADVTSNRVVAFQPRQL